MKRILVAVKNADLDSLTLRRAVEYSRSCEAELTILHIKEPDTLAISGYAYMEVHANHDSTEEDFQRVLNEAFPGYTARIEIIENAELINLLAERSTKIDLLVIGHHHQGLLSALFGSSTGDKVINKVDCDVLVVNLD